MNTFLASADPAPVHINLVDDGTAEECLTRREQPKFEQKERGELLPVERRHVSNPKKWKKNLRKFDDVNESDFHKDGETAVGTNVSIVELQITLW